MTSGDLDAVRDIDATVESSEYLHVEHSAEGLAASWKTQVRPLRERRTHRSALEDDQAFAIRQIVGGAEEGIALVMEHDQTIVAAAAATIDETSGIMRLVDLRIDFDFRRQGLASALMFQIIQSARERGLRAVAAQAAADRFAALSLLSKLGFEPTGMDTHLRSNHDLVKESVTLFFYLVLT